MVNQSPAISKTALKKMITQFEKQIPSYFKERIRQKREKFKENFVKVDHLYIFKTHIDCLYKRSVSNKMPMDDILIFAKICTLKTLGTKTLSESRMVSEWNNMIQNNGGVHLFIYDPLALKTPEESFCEIIYATNPAKNTLRFQGLTADLRVYYPDWFQEDDCRKMGYNEMLIKLNEGVPMY